MTEMPKEDRRSRGELGGVEMTDTFERAVLREELERNRTGLMT